LNPECIKRGATSKETFKNILPLFLKEDIFLLQRL